MAMDGVLLKIGAKSAVFSGNVHMVRCATALEECTTVHKSKIDPHIITCLDSDMWTARDVGLRNSTEQLWHTGSGNARVKRDGGSGGI